MTEHTEDIDRATEEHARQIDAQSWPGVPQLAAKWGVSPHLVRMIPRAELPYLAFGTGKIRRYDPADVARYEAAAKRGEVAA